MSTKDQDAASAATKTAEAARDAFFAAIPDPPVNPLVAAAVDHPEEADGDEPDPKGEAKPSAKKESAEETKAGKSPAASSGDLPAQVLAALKSGDLDLLADLTDQDPAAFDEKSTKWAARNRKESKLKAEVEKTKADAKAIVDHYEPIDSRIETFQRTKNYALVKELVEMLTGEDWDSVSMKTFRAVRGQDPRVPALEKSLAEREAELAETRGAKAERSAAALKETLRADLDADHQVRKIPGWEDRVAAVLEETRDEDTGEPTISLKQAAARVVRRVRDEYSKLASAFGEAPPAPRGRAETPERANGATPANKRTKTKEEFFSSFGR